MIKQASLVYLLLLYPYCSNSFLFNRGFLSSRLDLNVGKKSSFNTLNACIAIDQHSFRNSATRHKEGTATRSAKIFGTSSNVVESTLPHTLDGHGSWDIFGSSKMNLEEKMDDANAYYAAARRLRKVEWIGQRAPLGSYLPAGTLSLEREK